MIMMKHSSTRHNGPGKCGSHFMRDLPSQSWPVVMFHASQQS